MAVFEYKGLTQAGSDASGLIDADSVTGARQKLRSDGIFPTEIHVPLERRDPGARGGLWRLPVAVADLAIATRQLATLVGAGLPLESALSALLEQVEHDSLKRVIAAVREDVREGETFGDALARHPKVVSDLYVNMVRAGEASGRLEQMLVRLADFLESQVRLKNKIVATMTYPALMLALSAVILIALVTYVVPQVTQVFMDAEQALPWPTVVLIAVSHFLRHYGLFLLLAAGGAGIVLRRRLSTPEGKRWFDRAVLKLPVAGRIVRMVALSRFTRTLATLLASGVPLLGALEIVRRVVRNSVLEEAIANAAENIREGENIAEPLRRSGVFPPLVTQMIAVGEKSGELEAMLVKVADTYDNEMETTMTRLSALLEPVMILTMGVIVLFVVFSILLPIFEMSTIIR